MNGNLRVARKTKRTRQRVLGEEGRSNLLFWWLFNTLSDSRVEEKGQVESRATLGGK